VGRSGGACPGVRILTFARQRVFAAALGAVVLLASCAPQGGLDVTALEADLQQLALADRPGVVTAVSCPDPIDPVPGAVVVCEASIGAQTAPLIVTFGDERGVVRDARIDARLVDVTSVESTVAAAFAQDLGETRGVRCAQPVIVVPPGDRITCTVTDGRGVERDVEITPADDGTLTVALAG